MLAVTEVSAARDTEGRRRVAGRERSYWSLGPPAASDKRSRSPVRGQGPTSPSPYRRNREGADRTAAEIRALGRRAEVMSADVSRQEDLAALAAETPALGFGRVDAWINNAGADILTGEGDRLTPPGEARSASRRGSPRHRAGLLDRGRLHAGTGEAAVSSSTCRGTTSSGACRARTRCSIPPPRAAS